MGGAFTSLGDFLKRRRSDRQGRDDGPSPVVVVILLVGIALVGGILTTAAIIRRVAATDPLPPQPAVPAGKG